MRGPLLARIEAKIARVPSGCWMWTGSKCAEGYGLVRLDSKRVRRAHRVLFELAKGPIPEGLVLDHLCRTPSCVNPNHLEIVTNRTNVLRGVGMGARNAAKTHCKNGHALTPDNLYSRGHGYGRRCKTCHRAGMLAFYARLRQEAAK